MVLYYNLFKNSKYYLKDDHIKLLVIMGLNGFLTAQQLQLYHEVLTMKNTKISAQMLSRWSKRGGIVGVNKIQNHVTYHLKDSFIDWLVAQGYLYKNDLADRSENIHNIMVNQAIAKGIWQAYQTSISLLRHSNYGINTLVNGFEAITKAYRGVSNGQLINNSNFTPNNYQWLYGVDFRSYFRQLGLTVEEQHHLNFMPDGFISIGNTAICVELDNLTETNERLVAKISNYLYYAKEHPQQHIVMCLIFNDGSVRNNKVTAKKIPYSKIYHIVQKSLRTQITYRGKQVGIINAYNQQTNLDIFIAPLMDSDIDISDAIFYKNKDYTKLSADTIKLFNANSSKIKFYVKSHNQHKQYNRYANKSYYAYLYAPNTRKISDDIIIVLGQEHLFDTLVTQALYANKAMKDHRYYPMIVYPLRQRLITPVAFISDDLQKQNARQYTYHQVVRLQLTPTYNYDVPMVYLINNVRSNLQPQIMFKLF